MQRSYLNIWIAAIQTLVVYLSICHGVAGAGEIVLPRWARLALQPGEFIAEIDSCGVNCFVITTSDISDSLSGRVIQKSFSGDLIDEWHKYSWLKSGQKPPWDIVRVDGIISLQDARTAFDAVRHQLSPDEYIRNIYKPLEREFIKTGDLLEYRNPKGIGVRVGTQGSENCREIWVKSTVSGTVATEKGKCRD